MTQYNLQVEQDQEDNFWSGALTIDDTILSFHGSSLQEAMKDLKGCINDLKDWKTEEGNDLMDLDPLLQWLITVL